MTHLSCLRRQSYLKLRHSVGFRISMCPKNEAPQLHEYTEWPGFFFFYQWIYFFPDAALMQDSSGSDCERVTERAWEIFLDMDSSPQRIFETCSRRLYALGWISSAISSKHKDHNSALWWKLLEIAAKCRKVVEQHCLSNSEFKHEIESEELPRFSWMG